MPRHPARIPGRGLIVAVALAAVSAALACGGKGEQQTAAVGANARLADTAIVLGDSVRLAHLFSFPNDTSHMTLAQTVEHFLRQSIQRDQIVGMTVTVTQAPAGYVATFGGLTQDSRAAGYVNRVAEFLQIGQVAYDAVVAVAADSTWPNKPPQVWCFYLPLGLSLQNNTAVQLLHFPPDYTLSDQDYLGSLTTQFWEALLSANGAQQSQMAVLQRIVDIVPIVKDGGLGTFPTRVYSAFEPYGYRLLKFAVGPTTGPVTKPIVAYGGPVRDFYLKALAPNVKWGPPPLSDAVSPPDTLVADSIRLANSPATTAVLMAEHPSMMFYRDAKKRLIYHQLMAACWEQRMAQNPGADVTGKATAAACSSQWYNGDTAVINGLWRKYHPSTSGRGVPVPLTPPLKESVPGVAATPKNHHYPVCAKPT